MLVKVLICFFTGRKLFGDLPEDRKAKAILHPELFAKQNVKNVKEETAVNPVPVPPSASHIEPEPEEEIEPDINTSSFAPEYIKDEAPQESEEIPNSEVEPNNINEEENNILINFTESNQNKEETPKEEVISEVYKPKTSTIDDLFDDEDKIAPGVRIERTDK